jgi:hypothetical protein
VLVGSGSNSNGRLSSVALYDPVANVWTSPSAPTVPTSRAYNTATLLGAGTNTGTVLLAGGLDSGFHHLATAQLFDPIGGIPPTSVPDMSIARAFAAGTVLPNADVLMAGGETESSSTPVASTELYDPVGNRWLASTDPPRASVAAAAITLPSGQVLLVGGENSSQGIVSTAELYTPAS